MFTDKAQKQYLADANVVFSTEEGMRLLAYLKGIYITSSCLDTTSERTHYRLGQREMVQSLLNTVNDKREIDEMIRGINYTD